MKLLDVVLALFASGVGVGAFMYLYPLLIPLHQNPESIIGAEPAAWAALFVQITLLLPLGLLLGRNSAFLGTAMSFAVVCILLATAEGACKTGMLLFAGCSVPTAIVFALNVRRWLEKSGRAGPYLLAATLMMPPIIIGWLLFEQ